MAIDKHKAIKNKWRIPEDKLLLLALLGGFFSLGLSMKIFNHKIRKNKFKLVLIFSTVLHIFLIYKFILI